MSDETQQIVLSPQKSPNAPLDAVRPRRGSTSAAESLVFVFRTH